MGLVDAFGIGTLVTRVLCRREPILHEVLEFFCRDPRVRGQDQFNEALLAGGRNALHVASQNGCEWFLVFPFRVLRCHRFRAINSECQLHVHGLLGPECAVVVEDCDPVGRWYVMLAAFCRDQLDKLKNVTLGITIVPGREWLVSQRKGNQTNKAREERHSFRMAFLSSIENHLTALGGQLKEKGSRPALISPVLDSRG